MQKLLRSLGIAFDAVLTATGYIGGGLIVLSAGFVTYDTILRWVFRITSDWIYEYTVYMIGAASAVPLLSFSGRTAISTWIFWSRDCPKGDGASSISSPSFCLPRFASF